MDENLNVSPHGSNTMLAAVVIEVSEDGDGLEYNICQCDIDFRQKLMNGDHPEDNFNNCDEIPKIIGKYEFDIEYGGGASFNGDTTEYEYWCYLRNCRPYNSR